MSSSKIEIYAPMHLPATLARDAALGILESIAARRAPYEHVTLSMGLRDVHLPLDGAISVPVSAAVEARPMRWECRLQLEAEHNRQLFPRFDGTLTVTPNGNDESELWLQGSYEPPLGALGAGTDTTVLHGAAERSLQTFLTWVANEVVRIVGEHEHDVARAARQGHA